MPYRGYCKCSDVKLIISEFEVPMEKPYSSHPVKNLVLSVLHGVRYGKPKRGWQACCSQCDRIHLIDKTKKGLMKQITETHYAIGA